MAIFPRKQVVDESNLSKLTLNLTLIDELKKEVETVGHTTLKCTVTSILFCMIVTLTGCGGLQVKGREGDSGSLNNAAWPQPALSQAEKKQTTPGLSVVYYPKKIRHISEMPDSKWIVKNGFHGEPIQIISHQFKNGEVFGSGMKQEVCVQMQGYLNFEKTGMYLIKANSNDGIRVFLDNKMILDDPDVHSERFTPYAKIQIKQPGRYAILLRYFQRKGSATLEMYWKTPGSDKFDIIPATAYSHDSGAS